MFQVGLDQSAKDSLASLEKRPEDPEDTIKRRKIPEYISSLKEQFTEKQTMLSLLAYSSATGKNQKMKCFMVQTPFLQNDKMCLRIQKPE